MTGMTDEILKEDGVVLQYMGDGIVACWNVPQASDDHVDRACRAALAMTKRLAEVDPELRCGIGLHTGRVVAGTIGSDQIFAYGVIGAAISRAARVEGITRIVGVPIIATREVVDLLSESSGVAATPLGMYRPGGDDGRSGAVRDLRWAGESGTARGVRGRRGLVGRRSVDRRHQGARRTDR